MYCSMAVKQNESIMVFMKVGISFLQQKNLKV